MRKLVISLILLSCIAFTAHAEGYLEDFNGYNYTAVYNSVKSEILYGKKQATLKASQKYIINGPGGIDYGDSETFTANAAENIFCYTRTGDYEEKDENGNTIEIRPALKPVFGGLNNGWRGYYSHPQTSLDSTGGATAELNEYNRRLAVVELKSEPVLKMNPAKNSSVSTGSVYANDDMEFYNNTKWSTDVYINNISRGGYHKIALNKGEIGEIAELKSKSISDYTKTIVAEAIKFDDKNAYCFSEEAFQYTKKKWYTVEIVLKSVESGTLCTVVIKDRETKEILYSNKDYALDEKLNEDIDGMGYVAYTSKEENNTDTVVYIDNISVDKMDLSAALVSSREAAINGKGNIAIKFNSSYAKDSVNDTNIKLYCGKTLVEGYSVATLSQNRVKISLPVLEPATVYTLRVDGVIGEYGVIPAFDVPFKTISCFSMDSPEISGADISFNLKNNSAEEKSAYIMAVCENDEDMIENVYYKKLVMASGDNPLFFENIVSDTTKSVYIYVVDDISGEVKPLSDFAKINK